MIPSASGRPVFENGEPIVYKVMRQCRLCKHQKRGREEKEIQRLGGVQFLDKCRPMGKWDNGGCTSSKPMHNKQLKDGGGGAADAGAGAGAASSGGGGGGGGKKRKGGFDPDLHHVTAENLRLKKRMKEYEAEVKELKAELAAKELPIPLSIEEDVNELLAADVGNHSATGFLGPIPDPASVAGAFALADNYEWKGSLPSEEGSIILRMLVQYSSKKEVPVAAQTFLAALWKDKLEQVQIQPAMPTGPAVKVNGIEVVPVVAHGGIHAFEISIRVTHIDDQEAEFKSAEHHDVVNGIDLNSVFAEVKQIIENETKMFQPYMVLKDAQSSTGGGAASESTDIWKILTAVGELQSQSGNGLAKTLLVAQAMGKKNEQGNQPNTLQVAGRGLHG